MAKGVSMAEEKQMLKEMLDIIIDGVAFSTAENGRAAAGKRILDCLMLKYGNLIDLETLKQIQSIIESAEEGQS